MAHLHLTHMGALFQIVTFKCLQNMMTRSSKLQTSSLVGILMSRNDTSFQQSTRMSRKMTHSLKGICTHSLEFFELFTNLHIVKISEIFSPILPIVPMDDIRQR